MDKQQKTALILMPIIAIGILAGGMFMTGQGNQASADYTDGVYQGEGEGFNGPIKVEVTVEGGEITSVELLEHEETEGIGDTGAEEVIASIIASQSTEVDVSSGATYSSEGVMEAVSSALASAGGSQTFTDGEFEGEGEGFNGPIKVKVTVEDGELAAIELLEHEETEGIGDTGAEEVIANMIASQSTQVDVSSGATFSSEGVMEAVSNALAGEDSEEVTDEEEAEDEIDFSSIEFVDGVYEGVGEGFGGDVKVEVEVVDGELVRVEVLEQEETEGLGDDALEELSETMVSEQTVDVDAVSGATWSSDAIKEAVANALLSADSEEAEETTAEPVEFVDGVYEGVGEGFGGDVKVEVEVVDGELVRVEVLEQEETEGLGDDALEELSETMVSEQTVDVDAVSGATFSSDAIKEAVTNALSN